MLTIRIPRSAPYLPPSLRAPGRQIGHFIRFSDAERKILRKQKPIPASRWAELHRYVTMSVLPGRWRNDTTPYLKAIMDSSFFPSVQTIILCKAPQVGATESVLNCLAYAIDRDPGPALCVYPDELTAKENSQDRIMPMIKKSPRLRGYLTGQDDDASILRIGFQHMPVYMAWARSAAARATSACWRAAWIPASKSSACRSDWATIARAAPTMFGSSPSRAAMANALLRPGSPIFSRYVGASVSGSNSTLALTAPGVLWAQIFSSG